MEIPPGIQFDLLLELPYNDILNYCQINQAAAQICQSEIFWNYKLNHSLSLDLDYIAAKYKLRTYTVDPRFIPPNLSYISGPANPAIRYYSLLDILIQDAINTAIEEGQIDLFGYWLERGLVDFDNEDVNFGSIEILASTYPEQLESLWYLLPDDQKHLFKDAFDDATEDCVIEAAIQLRKFVGLSYSDLMHLLILNCSDWTELESGLKEIIAAAKADGEANPVQSLAEIIQEQNNWPLDRLDFLIEAYSEELDLIPLLRKELQHCPRAGYLFEKLNLDEVPKLS